MSYLTIKIISLVILGVIMLVFLANRNDEENKKTTTQSIPDDAFDVWLKQSSIHDRQKMLITALVKFDLKDYKERYDIKKNDVQSRMKILFDTLPKDLRDDIYKDANLQSDYIELNEDMLNDYILGDIEENPYIIPLYQKRNHVWSYFQSHFSKGDLYDDEIYNKVMLNAVNKYVKEMNDASFKDTIAHYSPVVVCFYDFNKPSEMFIPILEKVAQEYQQQVVVGIYDVYGGMENAEAASDNNITALPTFLSFKDGKQVNRHIGICPQEYLKKMFEELL